MKYKTILKGSQTTNESNLFKCGVCGIKLFGKKGFLEIKLELTRWDIKRIRICLACIDKARTILTPERYDKLVVDTTIKRLKKK